MPLRWVVAVTSTRVVRAVAAVVAVVAAVVSGAATAVGIWAFAAADAVRRVALRLMDRSDGSAQGSTARGAGAASTGVGVSGTASRTHLLPVDSATPLPERFERLEQHSRIGRT